MKTIIFFLLLSLPLWAQITLITNKYEIHNHGGWALNLSIGANSGDEVSLEVKCDHPIYQMCFAPPTLDGKAFVLVHSVQGKQLWHITVPNTGDHVIKALYPWEGVDVHYDILILADEVLQ